MLSEDPFLNSAIWFFLGVVSHKLISAVLRVSNLNHLFKEMLIYSLGLLKVADTHMELARDIKYKAIKEENSEISPEELQKLISYDEIFVREWRISAIKFIILNTPDSLKGTLKFSNWFQAMKYVEKEYKRKGL